MKAIEVREARIAQLQSDIDALQQVASILGATTGTTAKATTAKATPDQPKRHTWSAAEREAIGKRVKAAWAKRRSAERRASRRS